MMYEMITSLSAHKVKINLAQTFNPEHVTDEIKSEVNNSWWSIVVDVVSEVVPVVKAAKKLWKGIKSVFKFW